MIHKQEVKVEEWEDYEQAVARLCSLSSAFNQSNLRKLSLTHNLRSHLQVEAESLKRSNELDEMHEQLESRKLMMGKTSMHSKVVKERVKKQEDQLSAEVKSLLVAGTALSVASKHLQLLEEANAALAGERGCTRLKNLQKLLRLRQQHMVSQVSSIYPVKVVVGVGHTGDRSLTISGLHLSLLPFTETSFFTNKEVQRSATALGYVAHAVSLLASYLEVPLRYPICMGGSRSYIRDYAPSIEATVADLASNVPLSSNSKPIEFPLFLEGDTTRAAYAVYLLNKDLEQLLYFTGVKSLGPLLI